MLARVMTFYSESAKNPDLIQSMRAVLPNVYRAIPGFHGLLVLEKQGANHTIAVTLWEDETALEASAAHADRFAQEIGQAIGTAVSVNTYSVLGMLDLGRSERPSG